MALWKRLAPLPGNVVPSQHGAALSSAAELSHSAVAQLERGERLPRLDTVAELAKTLAVSPC